MNRIPEQAKQEVLKEALCVHRTTRQGIHGNPKGYSIL